MGDFIRKQKVPNVISTAADNGLDRISNLPDEILYHILSFLPTKFAAATSVLSSRWRYLFLHLPVINLEMNSNSVHDDQLPSHRHHDDYDDEDDAYDDYDDVEYCHNVIDFIVFFGSLIHRRKVPIKKFYCQLPRVSKGMAIPLVSVASLAISSGIPEVIIDLGGGRGYSFRNFLSDTLKYGIRLTVLKLNRIGVLTLPHPVSLPNLKAMELQDLILLNANPLLRLLSGCPSLEELDINVHSSRTWTMKVYNCSMNKLTLHLMGAGPHRILLDAVNLKSFNYQGSGNKQIAMNAPNLENLEITLSGGRQVIDIFACEHFRYTEYVKNCCCREDDQILKYNFKSLARSKISLPFNPNDGDTLLDSGDGDNLRKASKLMHLLRSVNSLNLSCRFLEVVFYSQVVLPTFTNLSCLEIEVENFSVDYFATWDVFTRLLESSPNLERLLFDRVIWYLKFDSNNNNEDFKCPFPDLVPLCISKHLREIEIRSPQDSEFEFKFVEYCVKNVRALKKMIFGPCSKATMDRIYSLKESMQCRDDCEVVFNKK